MAQRINVSLSDALYERLQKTKDRINVSQVCQAAIETAVTIEEIKLKDVPAMDKLIERLKIEKEASEDSWKQAGVTSGQEDAAELSYDEFRKLESDGLDDDLKSWLEDRHLQHLENSDEDAFLDGWVEGALSVWNQVKDQL